MLALAPSATKMVENPPRTSGGEDRVPAHPRRRLLLREALERGAGQIDEIGRHQRQHAGRQEAHQAGKERGEDRDVGSHAG
jgi:hypothetical protein